MDEESSDKALSSQTNGSSFAGVVVVSGKESDHASVEFNEAMVGDGNPVSIETQVFDYLLGASKRRFGVDHPFLTIQLPDETLKGMDLVKVLNVCTESEFVCEKGIFEIREELASEDLGKGPHRDKKIVS
jgi:hypothetical protein